MKNNSILFIDSAVDNYEKLLQYVAEDIKTFVLDSDKDGVVQITSVLSEHSGVENIHIVSHGAPATLYLGNSTLELNNLLRYTQQLQKWFGSSIQLGSLLLYGCNVASGDAGEEFITKLHKLTGANIGASTTKTGNANLGGNWNLEVSIGACQKTAFTTEVIDAYPSVLSLIARGNVDTPGSAYGVTVMDKYAYVADGSSGLQIIDISDPTKPIIKGSIDTPGSAEGVIVASNYAYVADGNSGLQIIDITDPTKPIIKGSVDTPSNALGIAVVGQYAYIADGNSGLQIIDISDPTKPTITGSVDTPDFALGVSVVGQYAYVADGKSGLQIIDISDPTKPIITGSFNTPDSAEGVTVVGQYAYVADGKSGLRIIDISDPTNPTEKGSFDTPGNALGVSVVGKYAYVADDTSLQVINISDPTKPSLRDDFDTPDYAAGVTVMDNYAYVADGKSGLQVFPTVNNKIIITNKGTVYTFAAADFIFANTKDDDGSKYNLKEVQITKLTSKGQFFLDVNNDNIFDSTEGITVNQKILKADLAKLKFKSIPEASGNEYDSFQFKLSDDITYSNEVYTTTFDINSAPTDLILNPISFTGKVTAGIKVATFSSVDLNTTDKYTYSLVLGAEGTDNDAFTIDGNSLKIKGFATKSTYKLRVRTTDAGGLFLDKDLNINFQDFNLTTGTTDSIKITQLIKVNNDTFSFKSKSNKGKVKISIKFKEQSFKSVNELSVFSVDDALGTIDGIAPGAAGYVQAALARARVISSPIANLPRGFSFADLSSVLEFSSSANLRFYMVNNSTTNAVLSGQTSFNEVIFSSSTNFKAQDLDDDEFELDFKGTSGNFKFKVKATDDELPLGSGLQGKFQGELLDFREVKTKIKAEFKLYREAAFDNLIGFYRVNDETGGIDTNNDGIIDIRPGDALYAQAAVKARVSGMDMTVKNQTTASFTGMFEAGSIFAPFIIANGTAEALLDSDISNDPQVYFSFLGANAGKTSHIRMLGNNTFGFEDQMMGGDKDYNDVICQMKFTPM